MKIYTCLLKYYRNKLIKMSVVSLFGIKGGIICQQVNCQNVMGAGLAKAIYEQFPIVKQDYHKAFKFFSKNEIFGKYHLVKISSGLYVANIYTQFKYGNSNKTGIVYTDDKKLIRAIKNISEKYAQYNIYIPEKIGCGLAGGNWELIKNQIKGLKAANILFLNTFTLDIEMIYNGRENTLKKCVNKYDEELELKY